jgi:hypothetical protein
MEEKFCAARLEPIWNSAQHSVILGVSSNPDPDYDITVEIRQGPVMRADSRRIKSARTFQFLETKRWMPRILSPDFIAPIGKQLNVGR